MFSSALHFASPRPNIVPAANPLVTSLRSRAAAEPASVGIIAAENPPDELELLVPPKMLAMLLSQQSNKDAIQDTLIARGKSHKGVSSLCSFRLSNLALRSFSI
jgi:hypothetical protein